MVIAVVDDLLFGSKIRAVAQAAGVPLTVARGRDAAIAAVRDATARLVIVDLETTSGDALDVIRLVRGAAGPDVRIVGYGSHVNVELLRAARDAGCDDALARSAFVAMLPQLMALAGAKAG